MPCSLYIGFAFVRDLLVNTKERNPTLILTMSELILTSTHDNSS
jgi:hypothetical protein